MQHITGFSLRLARRSLGLSQARFAELTGISQHILSAFELGKISVSGEVAARLSAALEDKEKAAAAGGRKKRCRERRYEAPPVLPERVRLARQTEENVRYRQLLDMLWARHRSGEKTLTAVSLFSGCGGLSLGFSAAGFAVVGHVEKEKAQRDIYRLNFSDSRLIGSDIADVQEEALEKFREEFGQVDAVIGGPPCQGFSLAGKREVHDPRNSLFRQYLRVVRILLPRVALLENVRLLTSMKSPSGLLVKDEITGLFRQCGYRVGVFEVDAEDYGVPQHRERVLFLAVREELGMDPSLPPKTHGCGPGLDGLLPRRTFADACSDLSYLESGQADPKDEYHAAVAHPAHVIRWLWDVPQGASAHDNEDPEKRPPSGYNTTYKRQVWAEPASTVQTTFGMISGCRNVHPIATRSLTIREAARIQSFPDAFRFTGNMGGIRSAIGNAVPPLLAFAVAEHMKKLLQSL